MELNELDLGRPLRSSLRLLGQLQHFSEVLANFPAVSLDRLGRIFFQQLPEFRVERWQPSGRPQEIFAAAYAAGDPKCLCEV